MESLNSQMDKVTTSLLNPLLFRARQPSLSVSPKGRMQASGGRSKRGGQTKEPFFSRVTFHKSLNPSMPLAAMGLES